MLQIEREKDLKRMFKERGRESVFNVTNREKKEIKKEFSKGEGEREYVMLQIERGKRSKNNF